MRLSKFHETLQHKKLPSFVLPFGDPQIDARVTESGIDCLEMPHAAAAAAAAFPSPLRCAHCFIPLKSDEALCVLACRETSGAAVFLADILGSRNVVHNAVYWYGMVSSTVLQPTLSGIVICYQ